MASLSRRPTPFGERRGELVVRETLLSRRPAKHSFAVAVAGLVAMLATSFIYWSDLFGWADLLPASREAVFFRGEYWRLATSLGAHADFQHFLSNGIGFGLLAFLLHGYYGPSVFPAGALALGGVVTGLSLRTYPATTNVVGASGVVYLMAGFWLTLYLFVERRLALKARLVRAVGFALIVLIPSAVEPQISYRTHAIGFLVGVGFALAYFQKKRDALRAAERLEPDHDYSPSSAPSMPRPP